MIFIKTDDALRALRRLGADLSKEQIALAEARAINHSLQKGRTIARTEIKKVYNISQRYLGGINFMRATVSKPYGELFASRKPIPLDAFPVKQEMASGSISISRKGTQKVKQFKRLKANPTAGVSIEIKKGEKEVLPYAFMIAGGAVRVFARGEYKSGTDHGFVLRHHRVNKDGSDTPIKPLITVSEFGSILNPAVLHNIGKKVEAMYPDRLVHEIEFIIDKVARSAG
jgi:hypothetical protein